MSERRTMPSGAEVHTFPAQNPDLWDDDEHFYAYLDCECIGGRCRAKHGTHYVQCQFCWDRHFAHPETQRVHKEQLAALDLGTSAIDHYFHHLPKGTL